MKRYKCSQSNDDDTNSIRERPWKPAVLFSRRWRAQPQPSRSGPWLSVGYSMVGKKILKIKPADLGRLDIEDNTKLAGTVALAFWTKDMLVKQRIIADNII